MLSSARHKPLAVLVPALMLLLTATSALARDNPENSLVLETMFLGLCGGLALFLFGMERLTEALKAAAGDRMRLVLQRMTGTRLTGALVGAGVTALIQSSSVTTVLLVGFVSAGLLSLTQSVGVIMGANIGSTITAQVIAFKLVKLALGFIAVGFAMQFFSRREGIRCYGNLLLGLGLVFYGMNLMGESMAPLRHYQHFLDLMVQLGQPSLGILVGAAFTALIQSSAATTGIVIALAGQGLLDLDTGIALALGANIGTCITALLAAAGKPRCALRTAWVHILFNILGVIIWCGFIPQLAELARTLSPEALQQQGAARLAAEAPRQIANAHTLFNLINTLLFLPFAAFFARSAEWLFPDRPTEVNAPIIKPKYLDEDLLDTPTLALDLARLEIAHLGDQILLMLMTARTAFETRRHELFAELEKEDDAADILYAAITTYLNQVGKRTLSEQQSRQYFRLNQAAANLESIGDVLETDLSTLGLTMLQNNLLPSPTMQALLQDLHQGVYLALEAAVAAIADDDPRAAQDVIARRGDIDRRLNAALKRQAESLATSEQTRLATLNAEFELTDKLKRIYSLSKRIARLWVPKEV